MGFSPSYKSQVNRSIWFEMMFAANNANRNTEISYREKNIPIPAGAEDDNSFEAIENFYASPDSGEQITQPSDSTLSINDSTLTIDSSFVADSLQIDRMAVDSTNRLKYFHYQREEKPYVELEESKQSKFFITPSAGLFQRSVKIDSSGKYVEISEKIGGQETKLLLRMPLDNYIKMKLALRDRNNWEKLGYKYNIKSSTVGLGELITSLTDFEIPLPKVGVLSIFGAPKISLKIGGSVQIHGAWRNETTEGVTASRLGNTRNEPDFKQQVQINVSGTIGDKLNISADWNTERTFQYENQLKIKYTGYEDEIIQNIEAGNVSMQTAPLIGGAEALFGIKAQFKLGPLKLTTIASQKKGETKEVSVSGGSTSREYSVRAYDYSENHYFIDKVYNDSTLFRQYFFNVPSLVNNNLFVNEIEVWKSINVITSDKSNERSANAYLDLEPISPGGQYSDTLRKSIEPILGKTETGRFQLLTQGVDYILHPNTGFISFKTSIQDQDVIAIAFKQGSADKTYGEFIATAQDTFLVLKLIKPGNLQPQFRDAWQLKLKNIYPTGSRNIKKEGFNFSIKYEVIGQEPTDELQTPNGNVKLLEVFGFDQQGEGGNPNPDDIFDWRPGYTIFPETGEIIFPKLQPFGDNIPPDLEDLKFDLIYDTTKTFARQDKVNDKWLMSGKQTGDVSSVYQLGFNVVENSARVLLDGRELTEGVDYVVDYAIGQLTVRNDAALVPGADLRITYEQNDLFQLASKTLLGARATYDFSEKTHLGFTIMNLNQQTLSDKVRIGEEPLSNTILGTDFKTSADLPFVTKFLDLAFSTREMSTLTFAGEYAHMSPDPNTKKSTISSDEEKSIAYIDDFEGAKKTIPIGIGYTGWKDLSPPDLIPGLPTTLSRQQRLQYKAKSYWYNITPSIVVVDDIFGGRRQVGRSDQQITVLDYVYAPDSIGTFNTDPVTGSGERWGGMQRLLSSTANNLVDQNVEFIEFWMRIADAPPDAKIYLDMGLISEDVIPNNILNSEDKNFNDAIDEGEDTGLDNLFDAEERLEFPDARDSGDPSGDNFILVQGAGADPLNYYEVNGTEGNAVLTDVGRLPDTEDLNRNGNVDLVNSYLRYEIPLDTNVSSNPFISGGGFGNVPGWYLYRIPLKDTLINFQNASLSTVETIRFFVAGISENLHLQIAEFNLVGSQWQKADPEDSVISISVVSQEENPDYTSPPGVFRERDRTRPDEEIFKNEQSLNLILTNLKDGDSREAVKYLFRPLDVFNYTEMKLFIHGEENSQPGSISYNDLETGEFSSEVFFRFGTDTNNYYEYRQPVAPGWNSISIKFDDLTKIKALGADSATQIIGIPVDAERFPGHFYRLKGNPTLTSVKFLTVGILNLDNGFNTGELSGEIWVNELRVIGADDSPGWAYSLSTSLKFADIMSVNFNLNKKNPYFHRLSERFGSRVESQNWAVSTNIDVLKLIPFNMPKSNLQVNITHTESLGKPLYIPGTDVRVDEAAQQLQNAPPDTSGNINPQTPGAFIAETQTLNVSNSFSAASIKLALPIEQWYVRDLINALSFGFNYNNSFSRSPTVLERKNWVWNASVNYGVTFSPDLHIKLSNVPIIGWFFSQFKDYKDVKINFTPQNLTASITSRRNRSSSTTRPTGDVLTKPLVSRDFTSTRGFNFAWKITEGGLLNLSTNYNVTINSSLAYLLVDVNGFDREESEIWSDIFGGVFFGRDYAYQQSVDFRIQPRLPSLWDINRYFTLSGGYSVNYSWAYDLRQEVLGRSAGFSSRITAGIILRWKSLTEPLFGKDDDNTLTTNNTSQRKKNVDEIANRKKESDTDSTGAAPDSLSGTDDSKPPVIMRFLSLLKLTVKAVFFDWENFTFNFSNSHSLSKSGLESTGTGFTNFWGLIYGEDSGPSRAFMLGFSSDPGPRAKAENTNLGDIFSDKNTLDFKTSRPLWEGAKVDVTWKVGWGVNKNTTLTRDPDGDLIVSNITSTGNLNRSFLSLPLPIFDTGIKKVNELYDPNAPDPKKNLSDAFINGFETFTWFRNIPALAEVAKYFPRANWHFTWTGLEKFPLFSEFAQRVTLDHSYSSNYTEGWKLSREGKQETQVQKIDYGFTPLVGLNITFGQMMGGNLSGNIKYSTRNSYNLGVTTSNITETFSKDIGFTASYSKSGFNLPLFGVELKNDIEFSLSYTLTQNSIVRFEMSNFSETGIPQDGTTRTTIEPRVRYTISSKVTLSIFYKRSTVEPEGAARIPPTTTNEAGLDVNIVIQ